MNNNNQNGKESDIITKKGFLISLPGKKGADSGVSESSIHMSSHADTRKDSEKNKNDSHGKKNRDNRDNRNDRNRNDTRDLQNKGKDSDNKKELSRDGDLGKKKDFKHGKDKFRRDKSQREQLQKDASQISANTDAGQPKQSEKQNNAPAAPAPERHDKGSDKKGKHGKNFNRDRRNSEEKPEKTDVFDKNDKADNKGDNRGDKSFKNDRNDRNRRGGDKKQKIAPLSALSADIIEHSAKQQKSEQSVVDEPSLEEKYKNAKPLSVQIAEQEMRAKGIKVPSDEQTEQETVEIVGVRFREAGKIYYFDPNGKNIPFGTPVIVETARGSEYGYTAISNRLVPCNSLTSPLKPIERIATQIDTQKHEANRDLEAHAESVFKEKVAKLGLEMNLIYVEYTFDNSRLLFYFTAETRIDFRELVKELAGVFRTRIELRQIGVRDEAKAIGGIGVCGRANCCNTFLGDFAQVSIKMAKDQSLSLNAAKISGACGKLMCCLRYEDKVYEEENARTPKVGSIVETPEGKGHVVERSVLKGTVKVSLDSAPEAAAQPFSRDEVKVIGYSKQKSDEDIVDENLDELKDAEG